MPISLYLYLMFALRGIGLAILGLILLLSAARAQFPEEKYSGNSLKGFFNSYVPSIVRPLVEEISWPIIMVYLSGRDRSVAEHISFEFPDSPNSGSWREMTRTRAILSDGNRVISLSPALVGMVGVISDANLLARKFSRMDDLQRYEYYLIRQIQESNGSNWNDILPFDAFVDIPQTQLLAYRSTYEYMQMLGYFSFPMNVFILTHELGHHVYKHPDNLKDSCDDKLSQEDAADRYAMSYLAKVGYPPFQSMYLLNILTGLEDNSANASRCHLYTAAICRAQRLYNVIPGKIENSSLFKERIRKHPMELEYYNSDKIQFLKKITNMKQDSNLTCK